MWVLTQGGNAVNVSALDRINIVQRGVDWQLEFVLNGVTSHIKGAWATKELASAALISVTGAVDAAN